ncbi:MAG: type IV pilus secretin PilQ [Mariprofundaceae bacterium]|nr:type IV pilus secretin PilQ [Mariprofundaceae bacterium]
MNKNQLGGTGMNRKNNFLKYLTSICVLLATLGMASVVQAAQITKLTLSDSIDGDVLRIESDSTLNYQVFDLDGPPRLILSFPEATLGAGVEALQSSDDGVTRVFPVSDKGAVRIEVSLSEVVAYDIKENNHTLVVHFSSVKNQQKASAGVHAVIEDIEVRDRGSVTELILRGEHMNANHNSFMTQGNQQLILDFWGASSRLKKTNFQYSTQRINAVMVGQAEDRVRLVVKLLPSSDMSQQIDATAGEMVIRLGSVVAKKKANVLEVESVDFKPDDRIAHVMIRTDGTDPVINVREKDDHIIIEVKKAKLLPGEERSQDVSAFPGPVRQIDTYQQGDNVRIVTRLREKVSVTSFQQGNIFTINFEPEDLALARLHTGKKDGFTYTGEKVTFEFKDIDIRNALKLIAEMSNLNIIMSDDVTGLLTMHLVDVPWDQALELILTSKGLGEQRVGNVMRVAPMEVLKTEYESKLEARKGSQQLEPLITEFIVLNYSKVNDFKTLLESTSFNGKSAAGNSKSLQRSDVGLLTSRGSFLVDVRTNTLIIKDTLPAINNIKRLVKSIDLPVKQVLIESRIVEASSSFSRNLGIRWGGSFTSANTSLALGSRTAGTGRNTTSGGNGYLVDLPAAAIGTALTSGIGASFGGLSKALNLNLELSAAELDGDVHIISNPRIVTTNLKTATIKQGVSIAVVTPGTVSTPATTTYKDALLELTVTPQITSNNTVIMDVKVNKDAPAITGTNIETKSISTNIHMESGETIVIGGIYSRTKQNTTNGVPGLSSIPILGWLFKGNSKVDNKTELLIFITPTILGAVGEH